MSSDEEGDAPPKLTWKAEHSLFVRNLSPQISEQILREVFSGCDQIVKVQFRAYPNSSSSFFVQIDFATLTGVTEGSKLSGVPILGVPCEIGVVDPVVSAAQLRLAAAAGDKLPEPGAPRDIAELQRRVDEAKEDQRLRTVHVAGLAEGTDENMLRRFCKNFGEVERLKVDRAPSGATFGLVEFKERGPAHVCKIQQQYTVDGRVLTCTEARVLVDESEFVEQTIQFQAPVLDAMGMRQILAQQLDLKDKLDKVRAAALELVAKDASPSAVAGSPEASTAAKEDAKEKKKKKKEEKKQKKAEKKLKKKLKKKEKEKKRKKTKRKVVKKKKPAPGDGEAEGEEEESMVASVEESSGGPLELDSEVEMVENTELCVLGTSSASSVSSTCSSEPEPAPTRSRKAPTAGAKGAKGTKRKARPLTLEELKGRWMVGGDPSGIWTILEGGAALFNGRKVRPKWSLVEDPGSVGRSIFCEGQRAAGWELDLRASTHERLVWRKADTPDTLWERQPEEPGSPAKRTPAKASPK